MLAPFLLSVLCPGAPLVLDVEAAVSPPRIRLGARDEQLFSAHLSARSIDGAVRLYPVVTGPRPLDRWDRWFLRIERYSADGRAMFRIKDPDLVGRGAPPSIYDFAGPAPDDGGFVAVLEVRAGDRDYAFSDPVVLPRPGAAGGPVGPVPLVSLPAGAGVDSALPLVLRRLQRSRARLRIEGHWDSPDDAETRAEVLATEAARALIAKGVDQDRVDVVGRGDAVPRFPTLSKRLRRRNRRVELILVHPSAPPPTRVALPGPPPRSLDLTVDGRTARVDLTASSSVAFTMDLDPPAQVQAILHDGRGGQTKVRRSVTARAGAAFVVGPRPRGAAAPADGLRLVAGTARVTEDGPVLEVELAAADDVEGWVVALHDSARAQVLADAMGEGPPPPRLELTYTSSAARRQGLALVVLTRVKGYVQVHGPWAVPALEIEPSAAIAVASDPLEVVFADLLDAVVRSADAQLVVQVHGGRRAARDTARRRMETAMAERGLSSDRLRWSAGRERGPLELAANVSLERPIEAP